ncbi:gamma-glutamyltransferase [Methylophaga muralis]|uniref:Glutathione hydrolase proenzyme n=1 Tax=Methylophaga muralis TaxID=291169 RepID=A0A1E3GT74_9GAMM|nr:gamma-glutamyltransferase [Methylophaga muralis]ODN67135.1 Gamma-glutamyltranspeptidase precursor [Methylophaga muralis]
MRLFTSLLLYLFFIPVSFAHTQSGQAAIASAHPLATEAGFEILQQGGNAFDAAIAVSAALAVVEPAGSGLGGGGFWLLHRQADKQQIMLDSRETAPAKAHRDMYLDENGEVLRDLALNGPLAAAIPGTPAALDYLSQHYGKLPLSTTLAPAIRYAKEGFAVTPRYQRYMGFRKQALNAEAKTIFLDGDDIPELGTVIIQQDLAKTLEAIAEKGRDGFYQGDIAQQMVESVLAAGGIWTHQDLANYQLKIRQPVQTQFAGYTITTAALPSAGGQLISLMLNQLNTLNYLQANTQQKRHLLIETMRRAYRERTVHLGDSDFVEVPDYLTDANYAAQLAADIDAETASKSDELSDEFSNKGEDTTHFSIVDQFGNRVSATLSINLPFGSGFVAGNTGVLLNNEMDDFSALSGSPNAYELVSESANAIEPGKRPLSSMTPSFVENDQRLLVIGTPGGSRIITMVMQGILHFMEGQDAEAIVSAPRLHHQYLPDRVQMETPGFSEAEQEDLIRRGHQLDILNRQFGNMQVVVADKTTGKVSAASDPRGEGLAKTETITLD